MTFKTNAVLADRLAHALKAQGVELKRSQIYEVAAYAFGYRNSNEMQAAFKNDKIDIAEAQLAGKTTADDGTVVLLLRDVLAGSIYGVDESFLEHSMDERREMIGITPYGHLIRFNEALDASPDDLQSESSTTSYPSGNPVKEFAYDKDKNDITTIEQHIYPKDITDTDGYNTFNVTAKDIEKLGLRSYEGDNHSEPLPLTEDEYSVLQGGETIKISDDITVEMGGSSLYNNRKWLNYYVRAANLDIAQKYIRGIIKDLSVIDGKIFVYENDAIKECGIEIIMPFEYAINSSGLKEWKAALTWLLTPAYSRKTAQVICTFTPQSDILRSTVDLDPQGEATWDGTFDALCLGEKWARSIIENDYSDLDVYAESPWAPEWARKWAGSNPFHIEEQGLAELFNIK